MSLVSEAGSERSCSLCAASSWPLAVSIRSQARAATGGGAGASAIAGSGKQSVVRSATSARKGRREIIGTTGKEAIIPTLLGGISMPHAGRIGSEQLFPTAVFLHSGVVAVKSHSDPIFPIFLSGHEDSVEIQRVADALGDSARFGAVAVGPEVQPERAGALQDFDGPVEPRELTIEPGTQIFRIRARGKCAQLQIHA